MTSEGCQDEICQRGKSLQGRGGRSRPPGLLSARQRLRGAGGGERETRSGGSTQRDGAPESALQTGGTATHVRPPGGGSGHRGRRGAWVWRGDAGQRPHRRQEQERRGRGSARGLGAGGETRSSAPAFHRLNAAPRSRDKPWPFPEHGEVSRTSAPFPGGRLEVVPDGVGLQPLGSLSPPAARRGLGGGQLAGGGAPPRRST